MKVTIHCPTCQKLGPSMFTTPLGPAFKTEANAVSWTSFIGGHLGCNNGNLGLRAE